MSSLLPSTMKDTSTSAEVQKASTWIERFALPLTVSVMEAQPIAISIALLAVLVAGPHATAPIGSGEIALVALGLLWWAMMVEGIVRRISIGRQAIWLYILGWFLALIAVVGPYLSSVVRGENVSPYCLARYSSRGSGDAVCDAPRSASIWGACHLLQSGLWCAAWRPAHRDRLSRVASTPHCAG